MIGKNRVLIYNINMKKRTSYVLILIIVALCIAIDLLSKIIIQNYFAGDVDNIVVIKDFFEITYLKNTGAAFGWFGDSTLGLTIVSGVFIALFVVYDYFCHSNNIWYILGLGFIVGGAIGNMIDRIFLGFVRDFISIHLFSFVFNLADLFITIGVGCFVVYLLISFIKDAKEKKNAVDNKK